MRVLWFEVTIPQKYNKHGFHGAGWQDALENIVKGCNDIELGITFECNNAALKNDIIDAVHYFPLHSNYSFTDKIKDKFSWEVSRNKLIHASLKVIEEFNPDVIHVFGSEWCFGQIAELTTIPVVIHMQGSIPPYNNAFYPPGYNEWDELIFNLIHLKFSNLINLPISWKKRKSWKAQEERTLRIVQNYMGRTEWDKSIVRLYQPDLHYFYCSEALRPAFIMNSQYWTPTVNEKIILTTTGCSSFWKGLDTIVRTARLLKELNVDFDWCIAGSISNKELIEWKEKVRMEDVNIRLMGMLDPDKLINLLLKTDIYIHTAYIDNSPNSICEAQYLGIPIIATYVGGIPSLIENHKEGLLVPANDPYILANSIIQLSGDREKQKFYSNNSSLKARYRHKPENILNDLLNCYKSIID